MLPVLVGLVALAALALALLWLVGRRQPVYGVDRGAPAFVAALKYAGAPEEPSLAAGVEETWRADARFTLIGPDATPYWDRFLVLCGGRSGTMPLEPGPGTADAWVAEVRLVRPPALLLGLLRVLRVTGLRTIPEGGTPEGGTHLGGEELGLRPELLPSAESATRLLAQPAAFAPAMMNFLRYRAAPRYPEPPPADAASTGRGAYGRYGLVAMQTVYRTGGRFHFAGRVERVLRRADGWAAGSDWDDVAVMQYPDPQAILTMERVPAYRAALVHRDAGLEATVVVASDLRTP